MVLTVVFADTDLATDNQAMLLLEGAPSTLDITYADDTLLVSMDPMRLQHYLTILTGVAATYGLKPNLAKTKHMRIGHSIDVTVSGVTLEVVVQAVYLGSLITSCGSAAPSLTRRIGEARRTFEKLDAVWKHANMTKHRKVMLYRACVLLKLAYSMECETLRAADYSRLDAFNCRCLRKILGIPHSMISRVANREVLLQAGLPAFSRKIKERQLLLYGRVAMLPSSSCVRLAALDPYVPVPKQATFRRRRGRPRLAWNTIVYAMAMQICRGNQQQLNEMLPGVGGDFSAWRKLVEDQASFFL